MNLNMKAIFQKNVELAPFTTFKIGGKADYFCKVNNLKELKTALKEAKKMNQPIFILGGGSNILVSDEGFRGIVVKNQNSKMTLRGVQQGSKIQNDKLKFKIFCEAGILLSQLVAKSLEIGATGLEWAIGIPGTVGGAICGNSGAYGKNLGEITKKVQVLNLKTLTLKNYSHRDCQFGYRESIFKKIPCVILSAVLELKKGSAFASRQLIQAYLEQRKSKIPPHPSAGSVFKNIEINKKLSPKLKEIASQFKKFGKIPAGYLIESCGLKGKRIGGAEISKQHANFIVNINKAKARDVLALINLCKKEVKRKFGVELQEEAKLVGFNYIASLM